MNLNFDGQKKKIVLTGLLVLVSASILSGGIYYTWLITPPGQPKTAQEGLKTISSARFERMPEYRKTEYLEQTQKLLEKIPQEQRGKMMEEAIKDPNMRESLHAVHENTMNQQMVKFANATPQERTKMLDEMIDAMQSGRGFGGMGGMGRGGPGGPGRGPGDRAGQGGQGRPNGPGGHGGPGRGNFRERIKHMTQEGNPQRMALRGEFMRAMQQRMEQRGIKPPQWGGGRR
jgi:hypothetical protein